MTQEEIAASCMMPFTLSIFEGQRVDHGRYVSTLYLKDGEIWIFEKGTVTYKVTKGPRK